MCQLKVGPPNLGLTNIFGKYVAENAEMQNRIEKCCEETKNILTIYDEYC